MIMELRPVMSGLDESCPRYLRSKQGRILEGSKFSSLEPSDYRPASPESEVQILNNVLDRENVLDSKSFKNERCRNPSNNAQCAHRLVKVPPFCWTSLKREANFSRKKRVSVSNFLLFLLEEKNLLRTLQRFPASAAWMPALDQENIILIHCRVPLIQWVSVQSPQCKVFYGKVFTEDASVR